MVRRGCNHAAGVDTTLGTDGAQRVLLSDAGITVPVGYHADEQAYPCELIHANEFATDLRQPRPRLQSTFSSQQDKPTAVSIEE